MLAAAMTLVGAADIGTPPRSIEAGTFTVVFVSYYP
jgi:hypothetical protein